MIIVCEGCLTRFRVDAGKLGATGRMVRCVSCGHVWHQLPPESIPKLTKTAPMAADLPQQAAAEQADRLEPEVESATASPPTAEDRLSEMIRPRPRRPEAPPSRATEIRRRASASRNLPALPDHGRRRRLVIGWGGLAAFVILFVTAALVWQEELSQRYARAQAIYAAIGLGTTAAAPPVNPANSLDILVRESQAENRNGVFVARVPGTITNRSGVRLPVPMLFGVLCDDQGAELRAWSFRVPTTTLAGGKSVDFMTDVNDIPATTAKLKILFASEYRHLHQTGTVCHDTAPAAS